MIKYLNTMFIKLQGFDGDWQKPIELVYSTFNTINQQSGPDVRVPEVRVLSEDPNRDGLPDLVRLRLAFALSPTEAITHFQGLFFFSYALRNRVRVDMEAPVLLTYSASVPGRSLLMDGRMSLKLTQPLNVVPTVRGFNQSILPLFEPGPVSATRVSLPTLAAMAAARNDSVVLEPVYTAWEVKYAACEPDCSFSATLVFRVPPQSVPYVPAFLEVAKFGWIQFLATLVLLGVFARMLVRFVITHQVLPTLVRDDLAKPKLL